MRSRRALSREADDAHPARIFIDAYGYVAELHGSISQLLKAAERADAEDDTL